MKTKERIAELEDVVLGPCSRPDGRGRQGGLADRVKSLEGSRELAARALYGVYEGEHLDAGLVNTVRDLRRRVAELEASTASRDVDQDVDSRGVAARDACGGAENDGSTNSPSLWWFDNRWWVRTGEVRTPHPGEVALDDGGEPYGWMLPQKPHPVLRPAKTFQATATNPELVESGERRVPGYQEWSLSEKFVPGRPITHSTPDTDRSILIPVDEAKRRCGVEDEAETHEWMRERLQRYAVSPEAVEALVRAAREANGFLGNQEAGFGLGEFCALREALQPFEEVGR